MKNLLIKPNANIKNALEQLSKTGEKCLVVVDKKNKILGTISDGDVRKAILKGKFYKNKISEFYQKNPIFLRKENYSLSQAKNILIKKRIDIIPIIEKSRKVVDVLTFEKIFKKNKNNHKSGTLSKNRCNHGWWKRYTFRAVHKYFTKTPGANKRKTSYRTYN